MAREQPDDRRDVKKPEEETDGALARKDKPVQ
jgi:hypothetical protein